MIAAAVSTGALRFRGNTRERRKASGGEGGVDEADACKARTEAAHSRWPWEGGVSDELVSAGLARSHARVWVPVQACLDEVDKVLVSRLQRFGQGPRARVALASLVVCEEARSAVGVEEDVGALGGLADVARWDAQDLHLEEKLLLLVPSRKEWVPRMELGKDAAQTPHVNGEAVIAGEDDLGTAVEARLDVRVHLLALEAGRAKVNDADVILVFGDEENVFRLEIAVDDAVAAEEAQAGDKAAGEGAATRDGESLEPVALHPRIQVRVEELEGDAEMVPEEKVVRHVDHVVGVSRILLAEEVEDLHFALCLLVEAPLVADDLDREVGLGLVVKCLDDVAVGPFAKPFQDFISVGHVVVLDALVAVLFVVEAKVVVLGLRCANLARRRTDVPDLWVLANLFFLVVRQDFVVLLQGLSRCHGER